MAGKERTGDPKMKNINQGDYSMRTYLKSIVGTTFKDRSQLQATSLQGKTSGALPSIDNSERILFLTLSQKSDSLDFTQENLEFISQLND